jgi:DNA-binding winged helix-turn-helix (wHTH) protein/tetratricopeptide (TPR) repeat protein
MSLKMKQIFEFEEFRLDAESPSLWRDGDLVAISPKALRTLVLLVQKKGEIVSREELIETVWKETFVEDGNINYTISQLRKIFKNKELIKTVPRHGYRFTGDVRENSHNGIPAPLTSIDLQKPAVGPRPFRWVFAAAIVAFIVSLTTAGYMLRSDYAKATSTAPIDASDAMQTYLRGKMILEKRSVENREEKAIDEFQRAVTLDPTLAIAYAGLAEGFSTSAVKIPFPKSRDTFAKAKVAADKALALNPNLAEGYLIRGWLRRIADWNWVGAESDLRHAIGIHPKSAVAHQRLAQTLAILGRHDEALIESKIAYELDPISEVILSSRFPILEARGDYDEALKESEEFLRENKDSSPAARAHATFLYHTRNYIQVIEIGEAVLAKNANKTPFAWFSLLAASYQNTGQQEQADDALLKLVALSQSDTKALYSLAMNLAELDRPDEALKALQDCFDKREERIVWLMAEPRFAKIRNDSRFQELARKLNLG